ncbi:MAG: hypothetical protein V4529_17435 [Gemmatimonadota bacterium]
MGRGGLRAGAGRPRKPDPLVLRDVYLEQRQIDLIKQKAGLDGTTFGQALRDLLNRGARAAKPVADAGDPPD